MADIYSKEKRSEIMSKISGKETKSEVMVRKYLFEKGFRFRKNDKRYPGKPDIVLSKYRTIIFIHGCFWHGHHCKAAKLPATRTKFWKNKISENIERDKRNYTELKERNWNVITVWQCELSKKEKREIRLERLASEIKNYVA